VQKLRKLVQSLEESNADLFRDNSNYAKEAKERYRAEHPPTGADQESPKEPDLTQTKREVAERILEEFRRRPKTNN